jgi:hypothetical protein
MNLDEYERNARPVAHDFFAEGREHQFEASTKGHYYVVLDREGVTFAVEHVRRNKVFERRVFGPGAP